MEEERKEEMSLNKLNYNNNSNYQFITFLRVFLLRGELSILLLDFSWIFIFCGLSPTGKGILLGP